MARKPNPAITRFIVENIETHDRDIGPLVSERFGVTRATASNYLNRMVESGSLEASGNTKARSYKLKRTYVARGKTDIKSDTQDDDVWRGEIYPKLTDISENLLTICQYGFTEMFNNVIDHANADFCYWWCARDIKQLQFGIDDNGVGVFEKIRKECNLSDDRQALLELSKGKLTSDPENHSGEGIFFTSRAFDVFRLASHDLSYMRQHVDDDEWLLDVTKPESFTEGTCVMMNIDIDSKRTLRDVFAKYEDDNSGFSKTHIHVALAKVGNDQLISRSQAKRLMSRLDMFSEIVLDFRDIKTIGQGFADEIFRVFTTAHPDIHIVYIRANDEVEGVILHVLAGRA